jgi:hypothetical protein
MAARCPGSLNPFAEYRWAVQLGLYQKIRCALPAHAASNPSSVLQLPCFSLKAPSPVRKNLVEYVVKYINTTEDWNRQIVVFPIGKSP